MNVVAVTPVTVNVPLYPAGVTPLTVTDWPTVNPCAAPLVIVATLLAHDAAVTDPAARGQVFSTLFIVSYTGFSIPAVVAGFAVIHVGLRSTAVGYGLFVLAMVILAAGAAIWRARAERRTSPPVTPAIDAELVTAAADTSDTSR